MTGFGHLPLDKRMLAMYLDNPIVLVQCTLSSAYVHSA